MSWILYSLFSTFLISLSLGQFASTLMGLWGASLVGKQRGVGLALSLALFLGGVWLLPATFYVLGWVLLTAPLALIVLLLAGSYLTPPDHPELLFEPEHSDHEGCYQVQIPDGAGRTPSYLLRPSNKGNKEIAVCVVHGAGDHKTFFKWRLVQILLAEGFTVLLVDLPGHGDYRHRPLVYPDCISTIPVAINFLRKQPGIRQVGLIGISLGGAMAIAAAAEYFRVQGRHLVEALAVVETPTHLDFKRAMFYREVWTTLCGSPAMSILREMSVKQIRESWKSGGYRGRHGVGELFQLLNPLKNIRQLKQLPLLLVYSRRDCIAPPDQADAMRKAAPHAHFIESKKASHVMLTLLPEINQQIADWLKKQLVRIEEPVR